MEGLNNNKIKNPWPRSEIIHEERFHDNKKERRERERVEMKERNERGKNNIIPYGGFEEST